VMRRVISESKSACDSARDARPRLLS
jgi:hypothetical protein